MAAAFVAKLKTMLSSLACSLHIAAGGPLSYFPSILFVLHLSSIFCSFAFFRPSFLVWF
jgi:hypothetical protein